MAIFAISLTFFSPYEDIQLFNSHSGRLYLSSGMKFKQSFLFETILRRIAFTSLDCLSPI